MPSIGDTKTLYGRNYVQSNPNDTVGPAVWVLTARDLLGAGADDDTQIAYGSGVLSLSSAVVLRGNLVYMKTNGELEAAQANSLATGVPVGVALSGANPGQTVNFTTNVRLDFANANLVVYGSTSALTPGATYYLSSINPGQWTTTPDTTTPGVTVVQCGQAVDTDFMAIEIQQALVV